MHGGACGQYKQGRVHLLGLLKLAPSPANTGSLRPGFFHFDMKNR